MLKIDIFTHILPAKYNEIVCKTLPAGASMLTNISFTPPICDLDSRFRIMDKFEGSRQVLTISSPPIEEIADSNKSADLAKLANDELAELVSSYPDRFVGAAACLPMNNVDATLLEVERAIEHLKLSGIQIYTPVNDRPLDSPEFSPLYQKMSEYDLPIWIHPRRSKDYADYRTESESKYSIFSVLGWPIETTIAMARLVFSGILEKYPNLKFITHHCGGMIPYYAERVSWSLGLILSMRNNINQNLTRPHIEYFKMFYNDTAINGNTSALMCARDFFGADHLLFGTDMPFDIEYGERNLRQVTEAIERMTISNDEKEKIFEGNAKRLLHISS
jgi:aminocarboxymuconate-semialdehyde decarboxylase